MILYFEQRLQAWASHINVYDEGGRVFCQVQGKLGWAQKYLLLDEAGNQIGEVAENPRKVVNQFDLHKGSTILASVKRKSFFSSEYIIDNGWNIEGELASWEWRFRKPDGSTAARLSRDLPGTNGLYGIVIADDVDPLLVVMAVVAVETRRLTQRSRKDRQELRDEIREKNRKYK